MMGANLDDFSAIFVNVIASSQSVCALHPSIGADMDADLRFLARRRKKRSPFTGAGAVVGAGAGAPGRVHACGHESDARRVPTIASAMMRPTCSAASTRWSSARCA